MGDAYSQQSQVYNVAIFVKRHQLATGLLLVFFSVADLWLIMPHLYAGLRGDWPVNWGFFYFYIPFYMSEWTFTVPILLFMSLVGTLMLSVYCVSGIKPESVDHKKEAAVLVTALGFTYQVIGAWPLWNQLYAWPWQAEIARYGNWLVLPLFIGSFCALIMGAASLYKYSKKYRETQASLTSD